ncbi:FN3 associated domain-containing protein [Clostridium perfringens]|nr:FN3 associated domain-containing protein [Clostridium perfringens]
MRKIVAQLYLGDNCQAKSKYMINVFDFDLNDRKMFSIVTQINQSLTNAISHDIAANGMSVAEQMDINYSTKIVQEIAKLILVSSLADIPHALLGLSISEIIGNLCEPSKDITNVKKSLEEFKVKAWYLECDKDGRIFFKNTKNMIAEMCSLVEGYSNEEAKKELRKILKDLFEPSIKDCYQQLEVFPAIDEIELSSDKVMLIIFEPYSGNRLHPDLEKFYNSTSYKNRVMFLSGQRDTMKRLYIATKELAAIKTIIRRMRDDKVPETNQQYQIALDTQSKKMISVIQSARETFVTLYYPNKKGIASADFNMEFRENKYDGEEQITKLLKNKMKFTDDVSSDLFIKKIEDRLFTRNEMMWSEIKERAAVNTVWQWYIPSALDKVKAECIKKDIWREHGSYIEKGPFEKEHTSVSIEKIMVDDKTGESVLRVRPKYGDKVYYEIGGVATTASMEVEDKNNFRTYELELSFLCVDSSNVHKTGEAVTWTDEPKVRYQIRDIEEGKVLKLETNPKANIRYTTDGSNPKENGGIYDGEFLVPEGTNFVQFVAEYKGKYFTVDSIKIDKEKTIKINIDKDRKITIYKYFNRVDTKSTYDDIKALRKVNAKVRDVVLKLENNDEDRWLELSLDNKTIVGLDKLENTIDILKSSFIEGNKTNITFEYNIIDFDKGENFLEWINEKGLSLSEFKESEIVQ